MKKILVVILLMLATVQSVNSQRGRIQAFGLRTPPVLVLDAYSSNAVAGYCLNKIRTGETRAIRVRRASDNTEQDIGFVGNYFDQTSLNSFCASTTCYCTTFEDQNSASTTLDLVQATTTMQPEVRTQNGRTCLYFDGTDDFMTIASVFTIVAQPLTYYTVADQVIFSSSSAFFSSGVASTDGPIVEQAAAMPNIRSRSGGSVSSNYTTTQYAGLALSVWLLISSQFDGSGTPNIRVNNGSVQTGGSNTTTGAVRITLGCRYHAVTAETNFFGGGIIEHLVYSTTVNTNIPTLMNTWLGIY